MAGRFKDQDPNFPQRTGFGKGLSDRTNERSMDEVRDYLKKLSKLLSGFERRSFIDAEGNRWEFAGRPVGTAPVEFGFSVIGVPADSVRVSPSVVSGMGAWATVPKIGAYSLASTPPPTLSVAGKDWVALTMTVEPLPIVLYTEPVSGDSVYGIQEGAGTLVGDIEVRAFSDEAEMESYSVLAAIDSASGAITASGRYVIPLATLLDGRWLQVGYYGPIGVRMCASGAITILSPARAPGVQVPPEDLEA